MTSDKLPHLFSGDTDDEVFMVKLIKADFNGQAIQFNDSGWFNATAVARQFNKRPIDWLKQKEVQEYISVLAESLKSDPESLYKSRKGRGVAGTWFHPKLGVAFARWLDLKFSVWCDNQIEQIIHGNADQIDWQAMRHAAKSSNKVQNDVLKMIRQEVGKNTKGFHYANEAKLVNFALKGEYEAIDRDSLSKPELDLLAKLEARNAVLLARGVDRDTRREILVAMNDQAKLEVRQ